VSARPDPDTDAALERTVPAKHPATVRCYFCATDVEMTSGMTVRMDLPVEACPHVDPADFRPATAGEVQGQ
jgi:hypothetical protein